MKCAMFVEVVVTYFKILSEYLLVEREVNLIQDLSVSEQRFKIRDSRLRSRIY